MCRSCASDIDKTDWLSMV